MTVMEQRIRTSNTADLVIDFSSECAIITDIENNGNETATSQGTARAQVFIDTNPVPVADTDKGDITLCSRTYNRTTSGHSLADSSETISDAFRTTDANGFSWMAMNVGAGIHTVRLVITLEATATNGTARVAVGKRILTISPTHAAVGEGTVADL